MHQNQPQITERTDKPLPPHIKEVFTLMFSGYQEVIVKSAFQSGLSGSYVFPVRPIRENGAELPAVVKVDRAARIEKEWYAYQEFIERRLPQVAEIRGQPVYLPDRSYGGVWYPLVGAGAFDVESFGRYCRRASINDIQHVLETRLCRSLETLWKQTQTTKPDMHLQTQYDSFLPVNLLIELSSPPPHAPVHPLQPTTVRERVYGSGDCVSLSGFQVVKVSHEQRQLSLDLPPDYAGAYRLHVHPVVDIDSYKVGQVIDGSLVGVIKKTQVMLLLEEVQKALPEIDATAVFLPFPGNGRLPNPLHTLPDILKLSFDAHVCHIHGDLNLENILVDADSRTAYLIDFAQSRKDHILRDLLHLEMSVVTRLLPEALAQCGLPPSAICDFYERLHCAVLHPEQTTAPLGLEKPFAILQTIRRVAHRHLFKAEDWPEYFYGLILYLLGALRYSDLDKTPAAKAVAFWGAAVTQKILETPPPCPELFVKQAQEDVKQQAEKRESTGTRAQTETHFYSPVTGPIHTGSGNINITDVHKTGESALDTTPKSRYRDTFSSYEIGTQRLLTQMGQNHPRYLEALGYQDRLRDNIGRSRRFGDTSSRKSDRAEIVEQLNELSLSVADISFNELCQEAG